MTSSYRRSSAEPGIHSATTSTSSNSETFPIIEECSKEQGVIRRFAKGRFLGKGGFAKCYEFTNLETRKTIAAKVIPKSSLTKNRARQKLMSEIKIHRSLRHTNIVGFEHFFEDHENVYILLEICTNQTMNELLKRRKRLTELEVQCYLSQILSSIKHLHKHRVIHRDLKLGNLFLSDKMEIKLGDFGLATKLDYDGERKRTICGTPNYIAPEILEGKDTGHSYEVDVWSFGVIAYTLLIGKPPFETNDVKATYKRIRMNEYSFPEGVAISSAAKNMIKRILLTDPSKRLTVDEIIAHEFFSSNQIPKLLPVSTLACPPSTQYVRQFMFQAHQQNPIEGNQVERHIGSSQGLACRSNSPRRFENTTPLTLNSHNLPVAQQNNVRSQQQLFTGFKDTNKKEVGSTYRTASAQMMSSSGGIASTQAASAAAIGKNNFDSNNINNQRIGGGDEFQPNNTAGQRAYQQDGMKHASSSQPPVMISGMIQHNLSGSNLASQYTKQHSSVVSGQQPTYLPHQQQQQQLLATMPNAAAAANTSNGGSGGLMQIPSNSTQPYTQQPMRSSVEKYSSNQNAITSSIAATTLASGMNGSSNNNNSNTSGTRAKSEKLNTQPQASSSSALMASYGIPSITAANTQSVFSGIATLTGGNLSSTNLKQTITNAAGATTNQLLSPSDPLLVGSDIWVKKWVDYSSKYGLGYLLSNGQVGVFFNDSTKIILNSTYDEFEYYERKSSDKQDVGQSHKINAYPSELQKKVLLLQHFRSYLEGDDKQIESSVQPMQEDIPVEQNHAQISHSASSPCRIYLKKWIRSKDAILFRLSNKVVQVVFLDKTEIILSNEMQVVTYVNKKHERLSYPLSSAIESTNQEMAKRLRYTKEILRHMLSSGSTSSAGGSRAATATSRNTGGSTMTAATTGSQLQQQQQPQNALAPAESKTNIKSASTTSSTQLKQVQSQQYQQQQQRENLHYSKGTAMLQPQSYSSNAPPTLPNSNPSNYQSQNENVNTLPNRQPVLSSQKSTQIASSYLSGKKEHLMSSSTNVEAVQQPQNQMKSNSTLMRMNSLNAMASASSSSLASLNHFNNYVFSSRKTEA